MDLINDFLVIFENFCLNIHPLLTSETNRLEITLGILLWEHTLHRYPFPMVSKHSFEFYDKSTLIFILTENILNVEDPGRALWMTREEYITFGTQTLAITDDLLDEDG